MKRILFLVMVICLMAWGCTDKCKKVICENGGTCVDGTCHCKNGYQGDSCNYESRSFFYGTYNVHATCSESGVTDYTANISQASGNVFDVLIANFANSFANNVRASVSGTQLTIPSQSPDNDGRIVSGSGTLSQNTIQMSYTIAGTTSNDVCDQTTWVK